MNGISDTNMVLNTEKSSIEEPSFKTMVNQDASARTLSRASINTDVELVEEAGHHKGASNSEALYHVVCIIAGTGILQIPSALSETGWSGIIALLFSAFVVDYTGKMLIACLYQQGKRIRGGYSDVGRLAFGAVGEYAVLVFYNTILLGITCLYIILSGQYFADLTGKLDKEKWILISATAVLVPFVALRTLKEVAFVSFLGAFASVIVAVIVWVFGIIEISSKPENQPERIMFNISGFPSAFGTFLFALGANFVYPEVEQSMRKPKAFPQVLSLSMVLISVIYTLTGVLGYLAYGSGVKSPILDSLPMGAARTTSVVVITLHVLLACPLLLTTFSMGVERILHLDIPKDTLRQWSLRTLFRVGTMALIAVISYYLPFFKDLLNLLGSVTETMLVFVFPVVFYYKIHGISGRSYFELAFGALLVAIGFICGALGGISAVSSLIANLHKQNSA